MKQALFVTRPEPGRLLDGAGLCEIRAFTPGTASEKLQALRPLASFAPPLGSEAEPFLPVRLALLRTPEAGRCVLHSQIAKPAPPGSFSGFDLPPPGSSEAPPSRLGLTHALLDLPSMVDPQQVLFSWGSEGWQQHDLPPLSDLSEALFVPVSGHLHEAAFHAFLKEESGRELFEFLLAAYLSTPAETPIFLVSPPEQVALALFGLTQALPASLLEGLTFSTYEAEPTQAKARVIGTCWPAGMGKDLPPICYDGLGVGFNATGTKTGVNTEMAFVRFAVQNLASGKPTALNEFHATWHRLGVKDQSLFDLVFRLTSGNGKLTKEESKRAMQDQSLAAWVSTHPDALPQLLQWGLEDVDYATTTFSRSMAALRQKPDLLQKLGQIVHDEGLAALKSGNLQRTRNALEVILPMVAPAKAANLWPELFRELRQPETLPWDVRAYLLPRLARLKPLPLNQPPDDQLEPWLRVPPENLPGFLTVDVPQSYHLAGLVHAESQPDSLAGVAKAVATQPQLALPLLGQLASKANGEARSVLLFEAVLAESPRPWLEDLLRGGRGLPQSLLDRCVQSALRHGKPDLRSLIRGQASSLIDLLGGQKSLDQLVGQLLQEPGAELLADEAIGDFLEKAATQPGLSEAVWKRLDAFLAVRSYFKHPSLHKENLVHVASAFGQEPPLFGPETQERLITVLGVQLAKDSGDVQEHLEDLILTLGPRYEGGPTPLYRRLLRQVEEDKGFWKREELLHAFVALSLDAAKTEKVNEELNGLDAEAAHLVFQIKRAGGAKLLQSIDSRTAQWPRTARRQWVFLTQSAQLGAGGGKSLFREAILVLSGAALALAVVALLRFLNML